MKHVRQMQARCHVERPNFPQQRIWICDTEVNFRHLLSKLKDVRRQTELRTLRFLQHSFCSVMKQGQGFVCLHTGNVNFLSHARSIGAIRRGNYGLLQCKTLIGRNGTCILNR